MVDDLADDLRGDGSGMVDDLMVDDLRGGGLRGGGLSGMVDGPRGGGSMGFA